VIALAPPSATIRLTPAARIASTISGTPLSSTSSFFNDRAPSADNTASALATVRRTAA
jgi:hypothetical protein